MAKGKKNNKCNKSFKQRGEEFDKKHIKGEFPENRNHNHVGNFHEATFKPVRLADGGKGDRLYGTIDGQKVVVARNVPELQDRGLKGNGEIGIRDALVTGEKDGKDFTPHHYNCELTKIKDKEYMDQQGRHLVEADSSESAEYPGDYGLDERTNVLDTIHEEDNINTSCRDEYNRNNNNRNNRGGGGGQGGGSATGTKENSSSGGGAGTKTKAKGSNDAAKNSYSKAAKGNEKKNAILRASLNSGAQIGINMLDNVLQKNGIGYQNITGTKGKSAESEVHVDEIAGLKVLGAGARASENNAYAGVSSTPVKTSAIAGASVGQASADAYLIEGIEVGARATVCDANAYATVGWTGAHVGAGARYARAEAGMKNTPLQGHLELAGAGGEAGASLQYFGASAGAHLGEAKAGPFGARLGFKFGAGVRNGIPEADLGPVTVPACCVM